MALSGLRCALLALSAAILLPATAEAYCRFAEMAFGQEAAGATVLPYCSLLGRQGQP